MLKVWQNLLRTAISNVTVVQCNRELLTIYCNDWGKWDTADLGLANVFLTPVVNVVYSYVFPSLPYVSEMSQFHFQFLVLLF